MTRIRYRSVWRVRVFGGPAIYKVHLLHRPSRKQHYALGHNVPDAIDDALTLFWEQEPELHGVLPLRGWQIIGEINLDLRGTI